MSERYLIVGGGGREHALMKKLIEGDRESVVFAVPGNCGMAEDGATCIAADPKDIQGLVKIALEREVTFAVVVPDDPLVLGAVDALEAVGVPCFGPVAAAAEIEGSKAFSKELMKKYDIPTAEYEIFTEESKALEYIKTAKTPIVVKADGLALGKGVIIAETREEAASAVKSMMEDLVFGKSGSTVVIEEFLTGPEVSVLSFTDGKTVKPMVSSMDHKRANDGDQGLNTGGMGTIAPNPFYTSAIASRCMKEIFIPTVNAMNAEGRTFKGCLYFGLMLTADGPKVIEYNCRFGDPETQVVLPLMKSPLFPVLKACREGNLAEVPAEFSEDAACCVVMASGGYPVKYAKDKLVTIPDDERKYVYIAGAKSAGGKTYTSGGRVLGVTRTAPSLAEAVSLAYGTVKNITFENAHYRTDIGAKALACLANGGEN